MNDVITVAEKLYYEANPNTRMDVPSYAYEQVEAANKMRISAMSELSLYDWCKMELNKQTPIEQLLTWLNQFPYVLTPKDVKEKATELLAAEKERDKQIAAKAWDAALNRDMEEREYPYGKRTPFICPDKEEYLKSLTK